MKRLAASLVLALSACSAPVPLGSPDGNPGGWELASAIDAGTDLANPVDLVAAFVVHVRSPSWVPHQLTVHAGDTVRFVFDEPGHNATTVTSAGDMDPVWYPDGRACSLGDCSPPNVKTQTSPAGTSWDFTFSYPANPWPIVCGIHNNPGLPSGEDVLVDVLP
jgi:plastocyanin